MEIDYENHKKTIPLLLALVVSVLVGCVGVGTWLMIRENDLNAIQKEAFTEVIENSGEYAEATQLAVDSDIVCVAAAGNDAMTMLSYPVAVGGGYGVMTGTSLASPVVAGALTLLKVQNKYMEFAALLSQYLNR